MRPLSMKLFHVRLVKNKQINKTLVNLGFESTDVIIANLILHSQGINLIPVTISKSNLGVQSVQWIINRKFSTLLHHHHRSSRGL